MWRTLFFSTLLSISSLSVYCQAQFEPGYVVDNEGNRTECLIRNTGKVVNPNKFEYRLTSGSDIKTGTLETVKRFGISNSSYQYERFMVDVDWSASKGNALSTHYAPEYSTEKLFLRILLEGEASLYVFIGNNGLEKYFFKIGDNEVRQLLYKQYVHEGAARENVTYKEQLLKDMTCSSLDRSRFTALRYNERSLLDIFSDYNKCIGSPSVDYTRLKDKGIFKVSLRAGIGFSGLEVRQTMPVSVNTFDPQMFPILGLETSYVLPAGNGRWSIIFQPTWNAYKTKGTLIYYHGGSSPSNPGAPGGEKGRIAIQYHHIVLAIGGRRHILLGAKSKMFFNASLASNLIINAKDSYDTEDFFIKPKFNQTSFFVAPTVIFGAGYQYHDRVSIDINYAFNKVVLENRDWQATFTTPVSLALGYILVRSDKR